MYIYANMQIHNCTNQDLGRRPNGRGGEAEIYSNDYCLKDFCNHLKLHLLNAHTVILNRKEMLKDFKSSDWSALVSNY